MVNDSSWFMETYPTPAIILILYMVTRKMNLIRLQLQGAGLPKSPSTAAWKPITEFAKAILPMECFQLLSKGGKVPNWVANFGSGAHWWLWEFCLHGPGVKSTFTQTFTFFTCIVVWCLSSIASPALFPFSFTGTYSDKILSLYLLLWRLTPTPANGEGDGGLRLAKNFTYWWHSGKLEKI